MIPLQKFIFELIGFVPLAFPICLRGYFISLYSVQTTPNESSILKHLKIEKIKYLLIILPYSLWYIPLHHFIIWNLSPLFHHWQHLWFSILIHSLSGHPLLFQLPHYPISISYFPYKYRNEVWIWHCYLTVSNPKEIIHVGSNPT